jgi:hypothetical protein
MHFYFQIPTLPPRHHELSKSTNPSHTHLQPNLVKEHPDHGIPCSLARSRGSSEATVQKSNHSSHHVQGNHLMPQEMLVAFIYRSFLPPSHLYVQILIELEDYIQI